MQKELTHSFRDRDVFLYTVLVPCLIYPILTFVMVEFTLFTSSMDKDKPFKVAYVGNQKDDKYQYLLEAMRAHNKKAELISMSEEEARRSLFRLDVSCVAIQDMQSPSNDITVLLGHTMDGVLKFEILKTMVEDLHEKKMADALKDKGVKPEVLPYSPSMVNLHPLKQESYSLHFILVLLSIMMMSVGVAYPAIAVSTEEYERKTIEATMLLPVNRYVVILGKLISVSIFGMFTGLVNFFSILGVFNLLVFSASRMKGLSLESLQKPLPIDQLFFIVVSYVVMGLLLSSLMLSVASICRTVRSAQNWVAIPMFVMMFVPGLSLLPNTKLDLFSALIPFFGLALSLRQSFTSSVFTAEQMLSILASLVYTAVIAALSAKIMYASEDLINLKDLINLEGLINFNRSKK